jgi:hypothetical protein
MRIMYACVARMINDIVKYIRHTHNKLRDMAVLKMYLCVR